MQVFGPQGVPDARPVVLQGGDTPPMGPGLGDAGAAREGAAPLPMRPGMLALQTPGGLPLQSGMMLRGQVLGRDGDFVSLQFGRNILRAQTSLPLLVGAFVDLQVQGQQLGKWLLQLVSSQFHTPMTQQDVEGALLDMQLPVDDKSIALARSMVEFNVPLTASDLQELTRALAQMPDGASAGREATMAACFLKAGNLPVLPQNIMTLANFLVQNPFLGLQLFQLQSAFRRLVESSDRDRMPKELAELLASVPGALGELALDPSGRSMRKLYSDMRRMAFQAGIENMGPHVGDDFDMLEWLASLRKKLAQYDDSYPEMASLRALLKNLSDNFAAHRLLNAAVTEQGAWYLQLPLRGTDRTIETRLIYHVDSEGRPFVDPDDVQLEIVVPTEHLGEVAWRVSIRKGVVALDVSVIEEGARSHLERFLPTLVDNLEEMGYHVQVPACRARGHEEQAGVKAIVSRELESLQRVNIQI
jgi:hypothetical protein